MNAMSFSVMLRPDISFLRRTEPQMSVNKKVLSSAIGAGEAGA